MYETLPQVRLASGLVLPDMTHECHSSKFGDGDIIDQFQSFLHRVMDLNRQDGVLKDTIIVNRRFFIGKKSVSTLPIDAVAFSLRPLYQRQTLYKPNNSTAEEIMFQSINGDDSVILEEPLGWVGTGMVGELREKRQEFARNAQPFISSILDSIGYNQADFL